MAVPLIVGAAQACASTPVCAIPVLAVGAKIVSDVAGKAQLLSSALRGEEADKKRSCDDIIQELQTTAKGGAHIESLMREYKDKGCGELYDSGNPRSGKKK